MWVTLLTDFGMRDPYVGIMKGVIARLAPDARCIDLCHDLPPQDVRAGAYALSTAWRYFPMGTIHLAVVDPGVGSSRAPVAFEFAGHRFVGPDNGLFGAVWSEGSECSAEGSDVPPTPPAARDLSALPPPDGGAGRRSSTFHGRDLFAPAAGRLARGDTLESLGRATRLSDVRPWPAPVREGAVVRGEIIAIDRFGNLITNIRPSGPGRFRSGHEFPRVDHYAQVAGGVALSLVGSAGYGELSVRDGSAAERFDRSVGDPVIWEPATAPSEDRA